MANTAYRVIVELTDKDKEAGHIVITVSTKGQAKAINTGTPNKVVAEVTKAVEL